MLSHRFKIKGVNTEVVLEKYNDKVSVRNMVSPEIKNEVHNLLINCWGPFPEDFIDQHIFNCSNLIIARANNICVGLCTMNIRNVLGKQIHYIEFLLIHRDFQNSGLGTFLSFLTIRNEILKNLINLFLGRPLEIFFITPNIRVLSRMAKFASFIYPNPYTSDSNGRIILADDETWNIATKILEESDNPSRFLEREGLVLNNSYANTPWLIYNNDTAPWHNHDKMNLFAKRYLGYHEGKDREFMVRANISFFSILKYILHV